MKSLFSFPKPVNETSARALAAVAAVLAVVTVAFQQGWLIPVLAYGFAVRAPTGPTLSPLGLLATVLWFAAGQHEAALALVGVPAVLGSLEAGLGLCLGCKTFFLGRRLGLVPAAICEECRRAA